MDLKLVWIAPISSVALPISLISVQPIWNNELRLATYQSYISDEIASNAYEKLGIKTTYFENDKEVLSGFKTGSYDLAIVSSSTLEEAISQKLVKKIDWEKLKAIPEKYKSKDSGTKPFNDELFSPIINQIFAKNSQMYKYGIPYFLSYLTFVYTGEKLKNEAELNWSKLLEKIVSDSRFFPTDNTFPKLAFIEDELTIFYISKLISGKGKENTEKSETLNFFDKLSTLTSKNKLGNLGPNSIFLNPNSSLVSEMMISGQLRGAFMYNGDALYTYQTMKENDEIQHSNRQFNIFEGRPSLWLLDSIAISAQLSANKEEKVYEFLNKLLFEGVLNSNGQDSTIDKSSWAWKNFDYLKYTPTLKELTNQLKKSITQNKDSESQSINGFDQKKLEILFGTQKFDECKWDDSQNLQTSKENSCQVVFESSLNDSQNLQLALAFQRWKSNL